MRPQAIWQLWLLSLACAPGTIACSEPPPAVDPSESLAGQLGDVRAGAGGTDRGRGGAAGSAAGSGGRAGGASGSGGNSATRNAGGGAGRAGASSSGSSSGGVGVSQGGTRDAGLGVGGSNSTAGRGSGGASGGNRRDGGPGAGAGSNTAQDAALGGDSPAVRFIGRVDTSDSTGPRFAWSGTGILARFSGTSVGVRLTGNQQYTVLVDGVLQPTMKSTSAVYPIATGLSDAVAHTVEIYRRTEANQGEAQFLGFEFGTGKLLAPPPPSNRRLEVIGDSITCGYGNEGKDQTCSFTPDTENHYLTYAAIAARDLEADLVTIAWSGKGVVCNYGDEPSSCSHPLPEYYDRALPERADSLWDFASWQPQAVVINLGTNDFSTNQDPTQSQFETSYAALLEHIREKYANALILCTVAPLLTGNDLATARSYIANAVKTRNNAGDANVQTFDMAGVDTKDGYGCDWHPSLTTHQKMAAELKAKLKADLGW